MADEMLPYGLFESLFPANHQDHGFRPDSLEIEHGYGGDLSFWDASEGGGLSFARPGTFSLLMYGRSAPPEGSGIPGIREKLAYLESRRRLMGGNPHAAPEERFNRNSPRDPWPGRTPCSKS